MASIQERLERLENERRFLEWFHFERFLEGLTDEELEAYASNGRLPEPLPEPLPKGASRLDRLDRKSLIKLWEEDERIFGHRSPNDQEFYSKNGCWPEERMRPRYYTQNGRLVIECGGLRRWWADQHLLRHPQTFLKAVPHASLKRPTSQKATPLSPT
jgi:hypothetical protein